VNVEGQLRCEWFVSVHITTGAQIFVFHLDTPTCAVYVSPNQVLLALQIEKYHCKSSGEFSTDFTAATDFHVYEHANTQYMMTEKSSLYITGTTPIHATVDSQLIKRHAILLSTLMSATD